MSKPKPNKFIAPIVIAGVVVGFLASAYKFVFAQPKKHNQNVDERQPSKETEEFSDHR